MAYKGETAFLTGKSLCGEATFNTDIEYSSTKFGNEGGASGIGHAVTTMLVSKGYAVPTIMCDILN